MNEKLTKAITDITHVMSEIMSRIDEIERKLNRDDIYIKNLHEQFNALCNNIYGDDEGCEDDICDACKNEPQICDILAQLVKELRK